jgi:type III restriction enzyme
MTNILKDKGAHFHKCDFQVHTPRDPRWQGTDAITDAERKAYAEELIRACREKKIDAIAVTDHHDFAFFPYIKKAAQDEIDIAGQPVAETERIIVFPGLELTLTAPACQALLILDADFPQPELQTVLTALAISQAPPADSKQVSVQRIPQTVVADLEDLYLKLNSHQAIKGRFTVFPNVSETGYGTILRSGFGNFYKSMPCVGGYTDGTIPAIGTGAHTILQGKNKDYGNKSVAVFQTSDNRKRDHSDLAKYCTWVKWAEPTAEALRQACLAQNSRISQTDPAFPLLQIIGVTVSDSAFLGPVKLGLNSQFNAFIGGRGTGKSSLLEYIRWALCDDPPPAESTELPNFQKRRKSLVDGTLKPSGAKVTVFYKRNEVVYRIERTITDKSDTINVIDPNGVAQTLSPEQTRREFPIVSYAQKQLSSVGTLPEEINRLITDPVKESLTQIQDRIDKTILPLVREQRTRELTLANLNSQMDEIAVSMKGKKEQIQALQSQLKSLTPEQQTLIQAHDGLSQQEQWLSRSVELPEKASELLKQTRSKINALGSITPPDNLPNLDKLQPVVTDSNTFVKKVMGELDSLISNAESTSWLTESAKQNRDTLRKSYGEHQAEYDKCVAESAKSKKQLDEIQSLNKQIGELETKQGKTESERNTLKATFDEVGNTHWKAFLDALKERAELLTKQCDQISELAQHEFKAELAFCADENPVRNAFASLIQGRNVKDSDQKVRTLAEIVCSDTHPIEKWAAVMVELDSLCKSKGTNALPATPILEEAGFTTANFESIRLGVAQESVETVRFMNIGDQIKFAFRLGKKPDNTDNYIAFESASPGQQATCLLRTLLAETGAPLLIDQPEEDLDNEQIHVLAGRIAETKHNRQLLFVSHNANIVVNGDAELVVCFGYRLANDNTRGKIAPVGSIDCVQIRDTIAKIMEGGREAFELRKSKYGF